MSYLKPRWPAPPSIQAMVSTRAGGVSKTPYDSLNLGDHVGDHAESVIKNRAIFTQSLPAQPLWLRQTHSTCVSTPLMRKENKGDQIEADASVINIPKEPLVIMTADCLPVLFTNVQGTVIGAAHAGWRGLCAGVLENTIDAMSLLSPETKACDLLVWLGPAIGPEAFEVGEDVALAFRNSRIPFAEHAFKPIADNSGKFLANIYELARIRLHARGVQSIFGGEYCTVNDKENFYSYRRDGVTGRFASVIWIDK